MFRRRPGDPDRMPDSIAAPRAAPNPEVPKRYSSVTAGAERSPPSCAHRRTYPRRISETRCCGHCSRLVHELAPPPAARARVVSGTRIGRLALTQGSNFGAHHRRRSAEQHRGVRTQIQLDLVPARSAARGRSPQRRADLLDPAPPLRLQNRSESREQLFDAAPGPVSPPEPWARRRSRRFRGPSSASSQRGPNRSALFAATTTRSETRAMARPSTSRTASTTT